MRDIPGSFFRGCLFFCLEVLFSRFSLSSPRGNPGGEEEEEEVGGGRKKKTRETERRTLCARFYAFCSSGSGSDEEEAAGEEEEAALPPEGAEASGNSWPTSSRRASLTVSIPMIF